MISVRDLRHTYDSTHRAILNGIALEIAEGEYVALIGPNGCGKTTLARHLNGLLLPQSGEVTVDGMDTRHKHRLAEIRQRVGMVFQNPENQIVGTTVEEDAAFGPGNLRLSPDRIRERVNRALVTVGLAGYETRHPHTLSGGEKQLLALAGVLAMEPKYIVLDEPTSSLDPLSRDKVLTVIQTLISQGIAVIHITHTMEDIVAAHRIIAVHNGTIVANGPPSKVLCQVEWLRSIGLAPPRITDLMARLHRHTGALDPSAMTVDEAFARIADHMDRLKGLGHNAMPEGLIP